MKVTKPTLSKLLEVRGLCCGYGTRPVLNGIDLSISRGESVLLVGPNGSGKSTLLKAVVGELLLREGEVVFSGTIWRRISVERRIRAGIGYLRQTDNIFPSLTTHENLVLCGLSLKGEELKMRLDFVLSVFDILKSDLDKRAGLLSGGQRQALAIGMVLMNPSHLYLFDEPTAGLSPKAAIKIIECLRQFRESQLDVSMLLVEHRLELLSWLDRAYVMIQGRIKEEIFSIETLLDQEKLEEHYF